MAIFKQAFQTTMGHEGGYVHDKDDAGGETYRGVARKFHPEWEGWDLIDSYDKNGEDFPDILNNDKNIQEKVEGFYRQKFWDRFLGDHIPDQGIAEELFDTGVNMGTGRAVKFLQEGLNILNRNEVLYDDIKIDGGFGPKTLNTLKSHLNKDDPQYILKIMNILQGMHYINYMKEAPVQEKFARGWLKRVKINKR